MLILMKFEGKYAICNDIHMLPYNAYWATTHFKRPAQPEDKDEEVFFTTIILAYYYLL